MEPFETLPNSFLITRYEYVFHGEDGGVALGKSLNDWPDGYTAGVSKRVHSVERVEDAMDALAVRADPPTEVGSMRWATALELLIRGEDITGLDSDGRAVKIQADLSDGGVEPPALPRHQPIAWELRRGSETAIEIAGRVWRTDMAHVMQGLTIRLDDEDAKEEEWRSGRLGHGDDPAAWADAEREAVAWADSYPGGRQTVSAGLYRFVSVFPQDLAVTVAWAATHPEETEPVEEGKWA